MYKTRQGVGQESEITPAPPIASHPRKLFREAKIAISNAQQVVAKALNIEDEYRNKKAEKVHSYFFFVVFLAVINAMKS